MNTAVVEAWIEELRSGRREQATGALCHIDENGKQSFCCLGVVTDMYAAQIGISKEISTAHHLNFSDPQVRYGEHGENAVLPVEMIDFLGLPHNQRNPSFDLPLTSEQIEQAEVDGMPYIICLAELNDDGFTFEQIADVIQYFLIDNEGETV